MKWNIYFIILVIILILLSVTMLVLLPNATDVPRPSATIPEKQGELSADVEQIIEQNLNFVTNLAARTGIKDAVRAANANHAQLTLEEIQILDMRWREAKDTDAFITQYLTNFIARELLTFQKDNPGFSEIFITDSVGLNVGQTNKTTDFYQADETWWQDSYNDGMGKTYYGSIEFDESAQVIAIPLYAPIRGSNKEVIGVVKAVLNIENIITDL